MLTTHALGVWALLKLDSVPYAILSHGNDLHYSITTKADERVARSLLGNASLILANSRYTADHIRKAGHQRPIEILNPGVDETHFRPGLDTAQIRHAYGLNGHRVLITAARLVAKKNVNAVLRALSDVVKRVPDVLYLIAGDGKEREHLERLCDERGLGPYVRFLGHIDHSQLPALYCASDLYVMPSYTAEGDIETFGISFVEANACGIPAIGGRTGGIADAIVDGETGYLVDPHDIPALAETMVRLLTDVELAQRMGQRGRERAEHELSWRKVGIRLQDYLRGIALVS
jgi:phosphatidylinositol alpha-1,6-mannosyltransferase